MQQSTTLIWTQEEWEMVERGFRLWLKDNPGQSRHHFLKQAVVSYVDGVMEANQPDPTN